MRSAKSLWNGQPFIHNLVCGSLGGEKQSELCRRKFLRVAVFKANLETSRLATKPTWINSAGSGTAINAGRVARDDADDASALLTVGKHTHPHVLTDEPLRAARLWLCSSWCGSRFCCQVALNSTRTVNCRLLVRAELHFARFGTGLNSSSLSFAVRCLLYYYYVLHFTGNGPCEVSSVVHDNRDVLRTR